MKKFTLGGGGKTISGGPKGGRGPDYKNSRKKTSYRTVIPTYTQSFSIPAQLESSYKSGELKCEEEKFWRFSKSHKKINIVHFDTQFFSIRSCVPTEAIEVLKINVYGWEQCKKKNLIQNGCPNLHPQFQHSSSIRKWVLYRNKDLSFIYLFIIYKSGELKCEEKDRMTF